ncbi:MAG: nucleoside kinase [Prevotellaceae bacterium]|jgi:uridine kinase|nr:nucleoside kinase [Prevotellaceae bacterium]
MKNKTTEITLQDTGEKRYYPMGTSLHAVLADLKIQRNAPIVAARVNNKMESLGYELYRPKKVEFVDISTSSGMRAYTRSLVMVFHKAVTTLFPNARLQILHPISKGYFCKISAPDRSFDYKDLAEIKAEMKRIIAQKLPFEKIEDETEKVVAMFAEKGRTDIVALLRSLGENYSEYYRLGDMVDFYNGVLVPSTDYLFLFNLIEMYDGVLLQLPNKENVQCLENYVKQNKMFDVFQEYIKWNKITHLENVGDVNKVFKETSDFTGTLIKVSEAMHEKRIARMADEIVDKRAKVALISGPSSSGKTTLSKRLSIQLLAVGLKPVALSLDNYFVERTQTPRDENGEYDYETLYSLDLDLFNQQLSELLAGKAVQTPVYDFITGTKSFPKENALQLDDTSVLIMEGIHALNPELTKGIADSLKYRIYVSALTSVSLDDHNWVPTSDTRLLRRIIRDSRSRGYTAQDTIARWESVRRGEDKWIFPYQENADMMFNSALLFELSALKSHAEPILQQVKKNCPEYSEAHRLLKFLRYLTPILEEDIPKTSLLREFLGGSSFRY